MRSPPIHHTRTIIFLFLIPFALFRSSEQTGLIDVKDNGGDILKLDLLGPYTIYRRKLSWGDARSYCEKTEGHLATFELPEDAKDVIEKLYEISERVTADFLHGKTKAEFGLNRRYWIGLTDIVTGEGNWFWAGKGTPLNYSSMWYPGQPDHIDDNGTYIGRPEHCVGLWNPVFHKGNQRHSFADMECDLKYYFICEKDDSKIQAQKNYESKATGSSKGKASGSKSGRGIPNMNMMRTVTAVKRILRKRPNLRVKDPEDNMPFWNNGWYVKDIAAREEFRQKLKGHEEFRDFFDSKEEDESNRVRRRVLLSAF